MVLPLVDLYITAFDNVDIAKSREIIHFHTLFNVFLAIIYLPLVMPLSRLCKKIVPKEEEKEQDETKALYLDEGSLQAPTIALAGAAQETLRMAKIVENMFVNAMSALQKDDATLVKEIERADETVDMLHNQIKLYLTRLSEEALDPKESDRFLQILSFSTNLEHIGDIIETSLSEIIKTKIEKKNRFSEAGFNEIKDFHQNILTNMKIAQAIFMSEDPVLARQLVEGKKRIRIAAQESTERHFNRLREGIPETISTSALHTDIIRDYRRINSYVTTVAYSILENADKHKKSRKQKI